MKETVRKTVLDNGVRVVTESVPHVQSISLGIWVATGARHEETELRGISHFLEHMLFKGTERRPTAKQIADEVDAVGGFLNAFTDKEYTCYYARMLAEHLPLSIDVLTDMYRNSIFDPDETQREAKVVLEEIKRRDDDPDDLVHDLFAQTIFPDHPLGLPVIGTADVVASLTPTQLRTYMNRRYGPSNVIVSAAGNLEHELVVELVAKGFGNFTGESNPLDTLPPTPVAAAAEMSRPNEQINFCVGAPGVSRYDDDKYALSVVNTVLGGSMGSRLFQEIREKRGLAYSVGTYPATHREGGYFAAYGGTSPDTYPECIRLVREEFAKVRRSGVGADELERAKNQARGQIVIGMEGMSSRMNHMGESEVYHGRVIPIEETLERINAVTNDDVVRVAERIFPADPEALTVAAIGPFDPKHREESVPLPIEAL